MLENLIGTSRRTKSTTIAFENSPSLPHPPTPLSYLCSSERECSCICRCTLCHLGFFPTVSPVVYHRLDPHFAICFVGPDAMTDSQQRSQWQEQQQQQEYDELLTWRREGFMLRKQWIRDDRNQRSQMDIQIDHTCPFREYVEVANEVCVCVCVCDGWLVVSCLDGAAGGSLDCIAPIEFPSRFSHLASLYIAHTLVPYTFVCVLRPSPPHSTLQILRRFLDHPVATRSDQRRAYLLGMRLAAFLRDCLPEHPKHRPDVVDPMLLVTGHYLEQMAIFIDRAEYLQRRKPAVTRVATTESSGHSSSVVPPQGQPSENRFMSPTGTSLISPCNHLNHRDRTQSPHPPAIPKSTPPTLPSHDATGGRGVIHVVSPGSPPKDEREVETSIQLEDCDSNSLLASSDEGKRERKRQKARLERRQQRRIERAQQQQQQQLPVEKALPPVCEIRTKSSIPAEQQTPPAILHYQQVLASPAYPHDNISGDDDDFGPDEWLFPCEDCVKGKVLGSPATTTRTEREPTKAMNETLTMTSSVDDDMAAHNLYSPRIKPQHQGDEVAAADIPVPSSHQSLNTTLSTLTYDPPLFTVEIPPPRPPRSRSRPPSTSRSRRFHYAQNEIREEVEVLPVRSVAVPNATKPRPLSRHHRSVTPSNQSSSSSSHGSRWSYSSSRQEQLDTLDTLANLSLDEENGDDTVTLTTELVNRRHHQQQHQQQLHENHPSGNNRNRVGLYHAEDRHSRNSSTRHRSRRVGNEEAEECKQQWYRHSSSRNGDASSGKQSTWDHPVEAVSDDSLVPQDHSTVISERRREHFRNCVRCLL